MKTKTKLTTINTLRQKVNEIIKNISETSDNVFSNIEIHNLIQEIDSLQEEIEKENEELCLAKTNAEKEAKKYFNLYNFDNHGFYTLSKEGEILELNLKSATILGKNQEQLLKKHLADFVSPETQPTFNLFLNNIFKTKTKQNCEIILFSDSYTPTYAYLTGIVIENGDQCVITMIDITKRKTAEQNLLQSDLLLKSTIDSQKDTIIFSIDTNYNYLTFNKAHEDVMKLTYDAAIKLGRNSLEYIKVDIDYKNAKNNYDRALRGESHSNIKIYGDKDPAYYESFFNPIIDSNNTIIGATGLARDITKRIKNEKAQKNSEEKYQTLFNSNKDSITLLRIDADKKIGNFLEANPATTSLFGYSKKEILLLNAKDVEVASEKSRSERIEKLLSTGRIDFETIIKNKKGDQRDVEIETIIINYLNEPAVMNITRDITERKQLENNIKKTNENLMAILDAIPDLLFEVDLEGRIHHYHSHRNDLLAMPPSQFMGKLFQDIMPAEVSTICSKAIAEANEKGWSTGLQYPLETPQGKFWFELSVSTINRKTTKDKHFIFLARNITDRKIVEEKLRDEKERIKTIFELVGNPIFLKDNNCKIIFANTAFYELFKLDEKEVIGKTLVEKVPKKEREHFLKIDRAVLDTGIPDSREEELTIQNFKHTIITKKLRYVNESGKKFLIGTIYDITERKAAEEQLNLASEKFQDLVNSTGGIVWEADANTLVFDYVSQEAERLFGYPVEHWYEKGFWENNLHPNDKEKTKKFSLSKTKKTKSIDLTYRFKTKDGNYIWLRNIATIVKENGKPRWLRGVMFDISKLKETNQALRESEEKYRGLVENSPDTIVIYVENKIVFINNEGLKMLEAKNKEEILGKSVLQYIHPDSLPRVIDRMREVSENDHTSPFFKEKFINAKGVSFDVEVKAIPITFNKKAGVQVIVHDITEQNRSQEKIRQLSQAVEQSPITIIITNTKGEIEYANPKFTESTGYTLDEIKGQNPRILKSNHTSDEDYKQLWQTLSDGKEWHGEFRNKKKNGELFWESATISPIVNSLGKTTHYIAIKEDITERKNNEQDLIQAKLKAEESDRLKLAFLANMSHEIRTPMNGILGFTELLKEPKLSGEEQQEYIKIIEKSGKRMLNIINDIISISKVESGQIEVTLSETNINDQIEYLNTFFKPETKQKGIALLATKKLPSEESNILTDREKLYAVLTNLVKNAIKFTNEGSIEFGCERKGEFLEFFVKDSGLGISKSQQSLVFERFRQANESLTRSHEGSGLGLAISKAYIEMLGGTIWVESELGIGSTFYFTIPFDKGFEPEEKNDIKTIDTETTKEAINTNLKVLIVEDDAISKLLISIALKPYSREIIKVSTGFEAIEACHNNPDIDLVMMDINMPEMGGYQATNLIREFNKDLVIIAQTANGMQSDRDDAIAAGCTDYISKPININSLSELINTYFKK